MNVYVCISCTIFDLCSPYMVPIAHTVYTHIYICIAQQYTMHTVRPNNTLSYAFTRIKEPMNEYTTDRTIVRTNVEKKKVQSALKLAK